MNFTSNINNKQDLGFIIPVHIPRMTWKGRRKRAAILGMGGGRKEKVQSRVARTDQKWR